ncbi:kinase-like domain-containing protein [Rhizophagus irregularis DAOM 181602=DAOM 197198]|nr:kinase-like domain-containing protein [Rhizophagus irregularis DAOM 181602=DAOM 197198]
MSDIIVEKQSTYKYYQTENYNFKLNKQQLIQNLDNIDASTINDPLCTELSKNIQNFFKINIMEIGPTIQDIKENIFEEDLTVELENVVAQFELAYMYYYGIDVDRSYYNAFKLFEKLSEKDNPRGMKWLGYCYEFGFGTEKNVDKAVYWYKKSADKGKLVFIRLNYGW